MAFYVNFFQLLMQHVAKPFTHTILVGRSYQVEKTRLFLQNCYVMSVYFSYLNLNSQPVTLLIVNSECVSFSK